MRGRGRRDAAGAGGADVPICAAAEKVHTQFSEEEIDAARRVLDALLEDMQDGTSQKS